LIEWCRRNLSGFAQFKVNGAKPPLDFPAEKFAFVYAYSVFTHLAPELQIPWFEEMVRVLRPGGVLLLTVHGRRVALRSGFSTEQLTQLEERGFLVFGAERSGENACAAYHSEQFMTDLQGTLGLELLEILPGGVRDASEQDIYLFRKRAAPA
jgi:SAM-dependent methyltransferase